MIADFLEVLQRLEDVGGLCGGLLPVPALLGGKVLVQLRNETYFF